MNFLIPWITIMIAAPLAGAILAHFRSERSRVIALVVNGLFLIAAAGAATEFALRSACIDPLDPGPYLTKTAFFAVDDMNATLLVFIVVFSLFIAVVVPMRKWKPGSASRMLAAESILVGGFASSTTMGLVAFWILSFLPLDRELTVSDCRAGCRRSFRIAAGLSSLFLAVGMMLIHFAPNFSSIIATVGVVLILAATMIRQGIIPFQSWLPHLFSRAPLPAVLMLCVPQWGTWAALRVLMPNAPDFLFLILGALTSATAVYASGISLVQTDARRAFGWLFVSETAIVFASLSGTTDTGLAGGLLLWLSSGLSLAGLGMTLCALEARRGRLLLDRFSGGFESTPRLASGFLLLGLCSVGFPGTLGFVGTELLIDGSVLTHPQLGVAIVVATVLNGLAVVNMYFRLFCGRRVPVNPQLSLRPREYAGFIALVVVLTILGLWPQGLLATRVRAAKTALGAQPAATDVVRPPVTL